MSLFKIIGEVYLDDKASKALYFVEKNARAAYKTLDKFGEKFNSGINKLAVGMGAAATAAGAMVLKTAEAADEVVRLSKVTGMSTDKIQELQYATQKLDVSLEDITASQRFLTKAMAGADKSGSEQAKIFDELGVSVVGADGHLRKTYDVFFEVIDALGKMDNETERNAYTLKLFGKSALDLAPIIQAGGAEIKKMTDEAQSVGAVVDGETVSALDKFSDTIGAVKVTLQAAITKAIKPLLPALNKFSENLQKIDFTPVINGIKYFLEHPEILTTFAGLVLAIKGFLIFNTVSKAIKSYITATTAATAATEAATVAQTELNVAQSASPIGAIVLGVMALAGAFVFLTDQYEKSKKRAEDYYDSVGKSASKSAQAEIDAINKKKEALTAEYADKKALVQKESDDKLAELEKQKEDYFSSLESEFGSFEEKQKSKEELISDLSGKFDDANKMDAESFKSSQAEIMRIAQEVHDKRVSLVTEEFAQKIRTINEQESAEIAGYQKQIDDINASRKKELADQKAADNARRLQELYASGDAEAIMAEIERQRKERLEESRDQEIETLNSKIEAVKSKASEEKDAVVVAAKKKLDSILPLIKKERDEKVAAAKAGSDATIKAINQEIAKEKERIAQVLKDYELELEIKNKTLSKEKAVAKVNQLKAEAMAEAKAAAEKLIKDRENTAQSEFILGGLSPAEYQTAQSTLKAAQERLRILGVAEKDIPKFASGVQNFSGGPAIINEGGRGEIVQLPSGANVIPHDLSKQIVGGGVQIHINGALTLVGSGGMKELARIIGDEIDRSKTRYSRAGVV